MLLVALSTLVSEQAHGTESTSIAMVQVVKYCDIHPYAVILYKQNNMILAINSYALYLYKPEGRSQWANL